MLIGINVPGWSGPGLYRRGTTRQLLTGFEIFFDHTNGDAVFALISLGTSRKSLTLSDAGHVDVSHRAPRAPGRLPPLSSRLLAVAKPTLARLTAPRRCARLMKPSISVPLRNAGVGVGVSPSEVALIAWSTAPMS